MVKPFVAIMMGSESDFPVMENTLKILREFKITYEVKIASAHRTPDLAREYIKNAENRGCAVFIAAAGLAAHLAGAVAAHTIKPVIGVPLSSGSLNGWDSLLSTVQMPGGTPVATVAIGDAGAKNAAYLAAQILALQDESIANQLHTVRAQKVEEVIEKNQKMMV